METVNRDRMLGLGVILLCICGWGTSLALPVADTGQEACYGIGALGEPTIVCPQPGEPFYGQDGSYTINPPAYTKLDAEGNDLPESAASWSMVRDEVTGRVWEMKEVKDGEADYADPHDPDNTYTWYDPDPAVNGGHAGTPGDGTDTRDFLKQLNDAGFGGFADWRLPTLEELESISDMDRCDPAIDPAFFPAVAPTDPYWSSTVYAAYLQNAWLMQYNCPGPYVSSFYSLHKSQPHRARAVRGGPAAASASGIEPLVDNQDGTVTDTAAGLMWQQDTLGSMTWEAALEACEASTLAGYSDWRCPTRKELRSIVDYGTSNPAVDTGYFPDTASDYYWSSSSLPNASGWMIHFSYGIHYGWGKSFSQRVRAVRGGQNQAAGHPLILTPAQGSVWKSGEKMAITWDPKGTGGNVMLSLSREGGKDGTFEPIEESTPNDGSHSWTVTGPGAFTCMLRITPLNDTAKQTVQGLFTIVAVIDEDPPDTPTGLSARAVSAGQINLSWEPSTDNIGVAGYKVYRDGAYVKSVAGTRTSDKGLGSLTEHCYTVSAWDAAGNESDPSAEDCATTVEAYDPVYVDYEGVCNGLSPCYTSLQAGILHAAHLGSLLVREGDYPEDLVMESDQDITLRGGLDAGMGMSTSRSFARSLSVIQGGLTLYGLGLDSSL